MPTYIHIGLHKTGTTTIQRYLSTNRAALLDRGLLYPESGEIWNAHYLFPFALNDRAQENPVVPRDLDAEALFGALRQEIDSVSPRATLISSEAFAFLDPGQIREFHRRVWDLDPHVIVYLRRQDLLVESEFSQRVKQYEMPETRSFQAFVSDCKRILPNLEFSDFLEPWSRVFGIERLSVGVVEPGQLQGGGLISDIVTRSGTESDDLPEPAGDRANRSPDAEVVEFLRLSNLVDMDMERRRLWNERILKSASRIQSGRTFFRQGQRIELLSRFDEQNSAVARRYFDRENGVLFRSMPDSQEEAETLSELSPPDLMRLAVALLHN